MLITTKSVSVRVYGKSTRTGHPIPVQVIRPSIFGFRGAPGTANGELPPTYAATMSSRTPRVVPFADRSGYPSPPATK